MKRMIEGNPVGLLHLAGLDGESAEPFDAELSTVSPAADYILRVKNPDYLAHFEFVSAYKTDSDRKMLYYGASAHYNHVLPIYGVLFLLRPEADGPAITGVVDYGANVYQYRVVRLWEMSPNDILNGPTALYPLAPLTNVTEAELPDILRRMKEPIENEEAPAEIWDRTRILLGLILTAGQANALLKGVTTNMMESTTYQEMLGKGEKRAVLLIGTERFGEPTAATLEKLEKFEFLDDIDRLTRRLPKVESWDELFATNPGGQN